MTEQEIRDNLENYRIEKVEFAYNNFGDISVISLTLDDGTIQTIQSPRGLYFDEFN